MHNLARILTLAGLAFVSAAGCAGQKRSDGKRGARRKTVVTETRIDTTPREKREVGEATVEYRSDDDTTTVFFRLPVLYKKPLDMFDLVVSYEVKGRELRRPEAVRWVVRATESKPVFRSARKLEIRADGKTFVVTKVSRKREVYAGEAEEFIYGNLDFASFEQVAKSKNIELRVGPFVMEFVELHKGALRDMVRALESQ